MSYLSAAHVTHVSYILILFSLSFLLYLFVNILLHIYATHTWPDDESNGQRALAASSRKSPHSRSVSFVQPGHYLSSPTTHRRTDSTPITPFLDHDPETGLGVTSTNNNGTKNGLANGYISSHKPKTPHPRLPHKHNPTDSQQVRDAEEFELEGLISDIDDDADENANADLGIEGNQVRENATTRGKKEIV